MINGRARGPVRERVRRIIHAAFWSGREATRARGSPIAVERPTKVVDVAREQTGGSTVKPNSPGPSPLRPTASSDRPALSNTQILIAARSETYTFPSETSQLSCIRTVSTGALATTRSADSLPHPSAKPAAARRTCIRPERMASTVMATAVHPSKSPRSRMSHDPSSGSLRPGHSRRWDRPRSPRQIGRQGVGRYPVPHPRLHHSRFPVH